MKRSLATPTSVKATQWIEEVRQAAGSVIVVSHNMAEVERMCDRALWLDHGTVVRDGTARRLIRLYGTTRSNPELMASLLDDESGPLGPLRPMDLRALRETRFVASQVEPWEMLGRAEIGGFPMSVPSPSVLDTSAVSSARAVALGAVHDVTDRPPHVVEGALLRDWLFEPESGAVLAEWPSASEPGQSIVLQETLSPFVAREHGSWRNVGGDLYLDRKIPRVDKGSAAVYCWSRWPHDPMHWWTESRRERTSHRSTTGWRVNRCSSRRCRIGNATVSLRSGSTLGGYST